MPTGLPANARLMSTPPALPRFMPGFILLAIFGIIVASVIIAEIKMSPHSVVRTMQVVGQSAACESGSCLVETATRQ